MIFLYPVTEVYKGASGLSLGPGLRLSEMNSRPELKTLIQGIPLELRCPDGRIIQTALVTYGIDATKAEDGSLIVEQDPYMKLFISAEFALEDLPPGTEIWWQNNPPSAK